MYLKEKIISYDHTIQNNSIVSIYNGITIYFTKTENYAKTCIFIDKKRKNIVLYHIPKKTNSMKKVYHADSIGNKKIIAHINVIDPLIITTNKPCISFCLNHDFFS